MHTTMPLKLVHDRERNRRSLDSVAGAGKLIQFSSKSSAHQLRKMGPASERENNRLFTSNLPPLMESVMDRIVRDWRRGIKIRSLAATYQLTVLQVERIVWCRHYGSPEPPTVRQALAIARAA